MDASNVTVVTALGLAAFRVEKKASKRYPRFVGEQFTLNGSSVGSLGVGAHAANFTDPTSIYSGARTGD